MPTAKEEVRKLLDELPEEASYEDIQYHIYVRERSRKASVISAKTASLPRKNSNSGPPNGPCADVRN
jgi:hypothetical protein